MSRQRGLLLAGAGAASSITSRIVSKNCSIAFPNPSPVDWAANTLVTIDWNVSISSSAIPVE